MARRIAVSHLQKQILAALRRRGGAIYAPDLARELFGYGKPMPLDLAHLAQAITALERRGWVEVIRRWGLMETGQLELLRWTDAGQAAVARYLGDYA